MPVRRFPPRDGDAGADGSLMRGWIAAVSLLVAAAGCATPTSVECYIDRDCPAGMRCDTVSNSCRPVGDAGGDVGGDEAAGCSPTDCAAGCRAAGYADGMCLGTTCQCAGTAPDGGTDDVSSDGSPDGPPDTSTCDPVACNRDCGAFGMTGTCTDEGCICDGGADADADADADAGADADADDVAPVDEGTSCPPGTTLCGSTCVDTRTSALHCGGCDRPCRSDQTCSAGTCVCGTGLTDCSGVCRDLATDSSNCGGCGNVCSGGRVCTRGICLCPAGRTDCGGTCVDTSSDPANCGWCGNRCACGPCSGGTCTSSGGTASFTFPDWSDTQSIVYYPYMWNVGDSWQGTRTTSLGCAQSVSFTLYADDTYLSCDVLPLRVSVNGTAVGTFNYPSYSYTTSQSFTFAAPILGPTYTIRLEATRSVSGGCGSVALSESMSPWTLN